MVVTSTKTYKVGDPFTIQVHLGEPCEQLCVVIGESTFEEYLEEKIRLWKEAGKSFPSHILTKALAQIEGRKFYLVSTD